MDKTVDYPADLPVELQSMWDRGRDFHRGDEDVFISWLEQVVNYLRKEGVV